MWFGIVCWTGLENAGGICTGAFTGVDPLRGGACGGGGCHIAGTCGAAWGDGAACGDGATRGDAAARGDETARGDGAILGDGATCGDDGTARGDGAALGDSIGELTTGRCSAALRFLALLASFAAASSALRFLPVSTSRDTSAAASPCSLCSLVGGDRLAAGLGSAPIAILLLVPVFVVITSRLSSVSIAPTRASRGTGPFSSCSLTASPPVIHDFCRPPRKDARVLFVFCRSRLYTR